MAAVLNLSLTEALWLLALGLPLLLALGALLPPIRRALPALAPLTALPALYLALRPPPAASFSWLLLGASFGLEAHTRIFLFFTALLWLSAGIFAGSYLARDRRRHQFFAFFLVTMAGNLGLIMALDLVSFYLFFVLMTFAAYGLIIHDRSDEARRAGQIYLILAVFGEALLIAGLLLAASAADSLNLQTISAAVADSPQRNLTTGLLLAGFGIKAGALPLHVWLPLAHPVAPTPASAVLSGAMIKAGLLGWLHFLPFGGAALPGWGGLLLGAGLAAAFLGVAVGLTQRNPKTVLAYSSISQMGLMTAGAGLGLSNPAVWPAALAAISLYALHHGLAKGALFLGVGMAGGEGRGARAGFALGLLLPALALAGAPFTSGATAKVLLKQLTAAAPFPWPEVLSWLLALAAVGTTLLMTHLLLLLREGVTAQHPPGGGQWAGWLLLLAAVAGAYLLFLPAGVMPGQAAGAGILWGGLWPVLAGALLGWILWRTERRRGRSLLPQVPAGDLLAPATAGLERGWRIWHRHFTPLLLRAIRTYHTVKWEMPDEFPLLRHLVVTGEKKLGHWSIAGALFMALLVGLFLLFLIVS